MCLAIPVEIIKLIDKERAIAQVGGVEKEISTVLVDGVKVGDFVILHVGYALTRLDEVEAENTLAMFAELNDQDMNKEGRE